MGQEGASKVSKKVYDMGQAVVESVSPEVRGSAMGLFVAQNVQMAVSFSFSSIRLKQVHLTGLLC